MKISNTVSAAPFLVILCNTFWASSRSIRREKRSVFDMITDIWQEGEEEHATGKHATVLSKVVDDDKEITFEDLRKIFRNANEKEGGKEENNKKLIRKEAIKKQFLEKIHRKNRSKIVRQNKENIIVNFAFLTKMS